MKYGVLQFPTEKSGYSPFCYSILVHADVHRNLGKIRFTFTQQKKKKKMIIRTLIPIL